MQIFFDLDGTLINSQPRLYKLFCAMCPENHFTYEQYWDIKRQRVTQAEMLKKYFQYPDDKINSFHAEWLAHVEDPEKMLQDTPFDGVTELLKNLSSRHELYIVTNRQSYEKTYEQIKLCGWESLITEVLVTEQKQNKTALAQKVLRSPGNAVWVGDTGEDMRAAKALDIPVIAVTWGVIHRMLLQEYLPDFIADSVAELGDTIAQIIEKASSADSNIVCKTEKVLCDDAQHSSHEALDGEPHGKQDGRVLNHGEL